MERGRNVKRAVSRNLKWGLSCLMCWLVASSLPVQASVIIPMESRIEGGPWVKDKAIYPLKGQKVELRVQRIQTGKVRWFQLVPDIVKLYHNANWPWETKNPYSWRGFDKIAYQRIELTALAGQWEVVPDTSQGQKWLEERMQAAIQAGSRFPEVASASYYRADIGTFFFQAEIEANGRILQTPGLETVKQTGLGSDVFRMSVRETSSLLGWLTTFFNVPAIFGSTTVQSQGYLGVDCADVLMAAWSRHKKRSLDKNYSVATMVARFPKVAEVQLKDGLPGRQLRWRTDVREGDFIAVKYEGAKAFQHIGALYEDADHDGVLSPADRVLHAGPEPLHLSPLADQAFDGTVVILRSE